MGDHAVGGGGWNMASLLYGFIILLYFIVAAVFLWFLSKEGNMDRMKRRWLVSFQNISLKDFCCRNLRRQRKHEYQERLREREKCLREWEDNIRKEKLKVKENDWKKSQTLIEDSTAEQKEEFEESPKPLAQKKTE